MLTLALHFQIIPNKAQKQFRPFFCFYHFSSSKQRQHFPQCILFAHTHTHSSPRGAFVCVPRCVAEQERRNPEIDWQIHLYLYLADAEAHCVRTFWRLRLACCSVARLLRCSCFALGHALFGKYLADPDYAIGQAQGDMHDDGVRCAEIKTPYARLLLRYGLCIPPTITRQRRAKERV